MTKVSVFGEKPTGNKELKQIELIKFVNQDCAPDDAAATASEYKNVTLLIKGYCGVRFDLILAYDDDVNEGAVYFGHWNDGIV